MTPDDFFDELDSLFPHNDGYINHLKEIKILKENQLTEDVIQIKESQAWHWEQYERAKSVNMPKRFIALWGILSINVVYFHLRVSDKILSG